MNGIILVAVLIAINCGCAVVALRRHIAAANGARALLAFNLVVLAGAASLVAMRP